MGGVGEGAGGRGQGEQGRQGEQGEQLQRKDSSASIKDLFTSIKDSLASIKDSFTSIKDSLASIKDSFTSIKDSSASIKDSFTSIKDSSASIKDLFTSIKDSSASIKDSFTIPYSLFPIPHLGKATLHKDCQFCLQRRWKRMANDRDLSVVRLHSQQELKQRSLNLDYPQHQSLVLPDPQSNRS